MKNFKRLLKGLQGMLVEALVIVAVLFAVVAVCTLRGDWIYEFSTLLFFLLFSGLVFLALLIYGIIVYCVYDRERSKLQAIPGFSEERFKGRPTGRPKSKICCCAVMPSAIMGAVSW